MKEITAVVCRTKESLDNFLIFLDARGYEYIDNSNLLEKKEGLFKIDFIYFIYHTEKCLKKVSTEIPEDFKSILKNVLTPSEFANEYREQVKKNLEIKTIPIIHCPTKELKDAVMKVAINFGCNWYGNNEDKDYMWSKFKENTCYLPSENYFISLDKAEKLWKIKN